MKAYILKLIIAIMITSLITTIICLMIGIPLIVGAVANYFIINAIDKRIEVKY